MIIIILVLVTLTLPCSFESTQKLSLFNFCTLIGEDCVGINECSYFEKCPFPFIYKCGLNKCARNASDCLLYLAIASYFNSRLFKTNAELAKFPQLVRNTMRNREEKFRRFQAKIPICRHPVYVWNSTDVCLLNKV